MNKELPHVLVVDDDVDTLDHTESVLKAIGLEVVRASGCIEARNLLEKVTCDVAVIDMTMPDFHGIVTEQAGEELFLFIEKHYILMRSVMFTNSASIRQATGMARRGTIYLSKLETSDQELAEAVRKSIEDANAARIRLRGMPLPPSSEEWGDKR